MLTTALTHLMGVGLVDQLTDDLAVLERKTRQRLGDDHDDQALRDVQAVLEGAREELGELDAQIEEARGTTRKLQHFYDKVDAEFRRKGGEEYEQRAQSEAKLSEAKAARESHEDELRSETARFGPLALVSDLVEQTLVQAEAEYESASQALVAELLESRDARLLDFLERSGLEGNQLEQVAGYLGEDRCERVERSQAVDPIVGDSATLVEHLRALVNGALSSCDRQIDGLLEACEKLDLKIEQRERRLQRVPDEEVIRHVFEKRERARGRLEEAEQRLGELEEARERVDKQLAAAEQKLDRLLRDRVASEFEAEDSARVLIVSNRLKSGLAQFRRAILERNLANLESRITTAFRNLLRKDDLVAEVRIDPNDFELTLIERSGKPFSPEVLSAGERQVLSISMLWGLAQSARRSLPTMVDTPLGRLDSEHRKLLVSRYFPHAGRQVILLSTDEEIVDEHLELLEPSISRSYRLRFDHEAQATRIEPGYFAT
jgi:DNA sulfur modification protein DndD